MAACWIYGYVLLKKGNLSVSVSFFLVPVIIQAGLVFLLLKGAGISALWSSISTTVYAGLFSKRKLLFCAIATLTFSTIALVVETFQIYPRQDASTLGALLPLVAINLMTGGVMIYFLRRSQTINENLFQNVAKRSAEQARVIGTFRQMQPAVTGAVNTISGIAASIASQAQQQAAAADEISSTLELIKGIAVDTNAAAAETLEMAQQTRQESLGSSELVRTSEQKFEAVSLVVEESAQKTTKLANQLDSIEDFGI